MTVKPMFEIIQEIAKGDNPAVQSQLIRQNHSDVLKDILIFTYCPLVKWLIPAGVPPYNAQPEHSDQEGRIYVELKKLEYVTNTQSGINLDPGKREDIFINLLEMVHPEDAKLIIAMKDGDIGIDPIAVADAYPDEPWADA